MFHFFGIVSADCKKRGVNGNKGTVKTGVFTVPSEIPRSLDRSAEKKRI